MGCLVGRNLRKESRELGILQRGYLADVRACSTVLEPGGESDHVGFHPAYLILAARSLGLDCGPMSGFDTARVDAEFFAGTSIRSNFLVNLGIGDPASVYPRAPRLGFAEACRIE